MSDRYDQFVAWVASWWNEPAAFLVFLVAMAVWGGFDLYGRRRK